MVCLAPGCRFQAQERHDSAEDRIGRLESQLEEKSSEVIRMSQRLKMNEEHNARLSATVDKLLSGETPTLTLELANCSSPVKPQQQNYEPVSLCFLVIARD